jgi:hypothetical protein
MKEKFKDKTKPTLERQTLYQLVQMKSFVDNGLKEVASMNFESDKDKIRYLLDTLYNIRDFVLSATTENSVRLSLLKSFNDLEEEEKLGNLLQQQKENKLIIPEESLEQDRQGLEIKEEEKVENTPIS